MKMNDKVKLKKGNRWKDEAKKKDKDKRTGKQKR